MSRGTGEQFLIVWYAPFMEGWMTLQEMADALGLKSTGSLRMAVRRGILAAEE